MKDTIYLLALLLSHQIAQAKNEVWVLIMDAKLMKKNIVRFPESIKDVHHINLLSGKESYVLLEATDSTKLSLFYEAYIRGRKLSDFPFPTYGYTKGEYGESFIDDYNDTFVNKYSDYSGVFNIDGRWILYDNSRDTSYCFCQYWTKNNVIDSLLIQYDLRRNAIQYMRYKNGKRHGLQLTFRPNGDTVCNETYKNGILQDCICFNKDKTVYVEQSMERRIRRFLHEENGKNVILEFQIDTLNRDDGRYTKKTDKGLIQEEGWYRNGKEIGVWKYYNESGKLIDTVQY